MQILYKPEPQQFTEDWLSRQNHEKTRDDKIPSMCITINAIESCKDILDYVTAEEIRTATLNNEHLGILL